MRSRFFGAGCFLAAAQYLELVTEREVFEARERSGPRIRWGMS
jgi:hypothetical protein